MVIDKINLLVKLYRKKMLLRHIQLTHFGGIYRKNIKYYKLFLLSGNDYNYLFIIYL